MQQTRATLVSETVIHRHKYISNPAVTPVDAVISAAKNLASALKGKMTQYLQESPMSDITRLRQIFSEAAAVPEIPVPQTTPPASHPPQPQPRRYPRITTAPPEPTPYIYPQRPPLPVIPPRVEPSVPTPRVDPPTPTPPTQYPRVEPPRRSARISGFIKTDQPSAPAHTTRIKNPNVRSVSQEAILSCAEVNQIKLLPKILSTRRFPFEILNVVLNKETGELMDCHRIMKTPKYRKLYCKSYSKELGRVAQGLPGIVNVTNTILFINKADVPSER